jgi:hypothetical protein
MSISATNQLAPARRLSFPMIAGAVLGVLALFAVLVAISVSRTSSATTQSDVIAPVPAVATHGYFRDPATHALLAVETTIPGDTPGARP